MNPEVRRTYWRWFFAAAALEAGAAFVVLARIPSEGLSAFRLALFGVLLAFALLGAFWALRVPRGIEKWTQPGNILAAAVLGVMLGVALFLLRYLDPARLLPIYARLSPLLWYLALLAVQTAIFLTVLRYGLHAEALGTRRPLLIPGAIAFSVLLFVFGFVALTGLGTIPDPAYWGEPGVPLLGWQFTLALLLGGAVFCFTLARPGLLRRDSLIAAAIWLLAVTLWLSVPVDVLRNSFYVQIDPPAHEPFPYSDAGYYDSMAHSLLIGHPYQGQIPTRPLYVVFLAFLHAVFGENYRLIIAGQTLVLAFIPVMLYQLAAKLHSAAAGITVAVFFIFRECTTLLISSETRVSHTKTLLADLPTLLFLLIACWFALRWIERRDTRSAFLAGGAFGLCILLRTQSIMILPLLLALALAAHGFKDRAWIAGVLVFFLGLAVTVMPWLTHNYLRIGSFAFDAPFQYEVLASQYAYSGNLDVQNYDFADKSLAGVLIDFTLKDPGFVFGFIANHFLAGEIGGLLALPLIETYNGIFEPVNLYWLKWDGHLTRANVSLVLGYLAVIATGIGAAWRRWRWAGLLPLVFNVGYALATAVGRFSGWRYDLPADWVPYFYFGIGFAELVGLAAAVVGANQENEQTSKAPTAAEHNRPRGLPVVFQPLLLFAFCFSLIGALPWLAEYSATPRYRNASAPDLESRLSLVSGLSDSEIQAFRTQSDAVLTEGRLLYPRFFRRDGGIASANAWPAYAVRGYPRTGFKLLNTTLTDALMPGRDPQPFPHAADAILLGCQQEDHIEVRVIAFPESDAFYVSEAALAPCVPP